MHPVQSIHHISWSKSEELYIKRKLRNVVYVQEHKTFLQNLYQQYIKRETKISAQKRSHQWHRIDAAAENEFSQRNALACILSKAFITFLGQNQKNFISKESSESGLSFDM
jgi:hypothetical protein